MVSLLGCEFHPNKLTFQAQRAIRGCLTHLPVPLALAPVADVGHGLRAALEHTKAVAHAVDHFSFVGAAIRPRVLASVHGDVFHKVPLRQKGQKSQQAGRERFLSLGGGARWQGWWCLRHILYHPSIPASPPVETGNYPPASTPPPSFTTQPVRPHPVPPLGRSPGRRMQLEGCVQTEPQAASRGQQPREHGFLEPTLKEAVSGSGHPSPLLEGTLVLANDLKMHPPFSPARWVKESCP